MALFDDTVPANSEAVQLGAQRIREIKTVLNATLDQIFSDTSGTFQTGWITSSMFASKSVVTAAIADAAVTATQIATGAVGPSQLAANAVTSAAIAGSAVGTAAIAANAVTSAQLAASAVGIAAAGTGVAKIKIGTYSGSNSASAVITGVGFAPDLVIITGGASNHNTALAFRAEGNAVHALWRSDGVGSPWNSAITWGSDGFTISSTNNTAINQLGVTHTYIAVKV